MKGDRQVEEPKDDVFKHFQEEKLSLSIISTPNIILHSSDNNVLFDEVAILEQEDKLMRKSSVLFKDISKADLKTIKERPLTPLQRKSPIDEEDERSLPVIHLDRVKSQSKTKLLSDEDRMTVLQRKSTLYPLLKHDIHTDQNSIIKLEKNCIFIYIILDKTDDIDLKYLIDLLNENIKTNWKSVMNLEHLKIYKKSVKGNPTILLKTYAEIRGYTKDEVFEAITDVSIRKEWDKIFSEFKVIENNKDEGEYLYMSIKV